MPEFTFEEFLRDEYPEAVKSKEEVKKDEEKASKIKFSKEKVT